MKLNQDCIRDLLLYLEENLSLGSHIAINNIKVKDYSQEDLIYTSQRLFEAGYLNCKISNFVTSRIPFIDVTSLTYSGHQFLDTIRDDGIWKETKKKASQIASISLPIIYELATSAIKIKLGLS